MNKNLKSILKYIIEVIIVAFGVFLGIYYSNINEDNKTKKEKEKSLSLIIGELETNQELLKSDIDYHENIKIQIDSIIPNLSDKDLYSTFIGSDFKHAEIDGWTGFRFSRLQKTAFESAKTSGIIKEFDIELIQKLSNIYYYQDTYVGFGESILNKAIETNSSTKVVDFIGIIELMTSDLLGVEKNLSKELEKTITELKTTHNKV
ncbi:hypothetical protein [Aquimarina mytili]|uniref:Uncharacterized protein n=1 Tax=Aquimarina mytili TaxID=874423 RepID=A0A937DAM0_9FLAO|nr:hypothetical protein [Aquimarina mytili]MBL0686140.1 hypothetical protein [Aquimarina mytili]